MTQPDFTNELKEQELLNSNIDTDAIESAVTSILRAFGEDPDREGLKNTPKRVALMYPELLSGYRTDAKKLVNGALFTVDYDDMVIVRDIEFYSLCEHHMLPFIGRAHVAYIPKGKVIGLSKIPRIVDVVMRASCFFTPRIIEHMCRASTTTATPCGSSRWLMKSAI